MMDKQSKTNHVIMANEIGHTRYSSPKLKWNFQFIQNDQKPNESIK